MNVENLRLAADYKGDSIDTEDADWVVKQSELFVAQVGSSFFD